MKSVNFHMQMDCESGVPEFFLGEFTGHQLPHSAARVRAILEELLKQLRFIESSNGYRECDLDINDQDELVLWDLEPEDDSYSTTFVERVGETIVEVQYQLGVLADLEANQSDLF